MDDLERRGIVAIDIVRNDCASGLHSLQDGMTTGFDCQGPSELGANWMRRRNGPPAHNDVHPP
jgi:hypothetical protein